MGIREERLARAASMPHRAAAGENSIDARLESTIGRFYFQGLISESEFQAGVRYGKIIIDYLQAIDCPAPYGNGFDELAENVCFQRKILASQSRQILKDAAAASGTPQAQVISAVDALTVYAEAPSGEAQMRALRIGLRALAHGSNVIPLHRTK